MKNYDFVHCQNSYINFHFYRLVLSSCSLPIDTMSGETVYAEGSGRAKKEAVLECALTACRMLDTEGILRESRKGMFHVVQ